MDQRLLEILACPVCKGPVEHDKTNQELVCRACSPSGLAYPIQDGIPVMLEEEARQLELNRQA